MNERTRSLADLVLARSPLQRVYSRSSAKRLTVLAYHRIARHSFFATHMTHLRRHAHPVSLQDAVDALHGRGVLPDRATLVTFDDADRSIRDFALPILQERSIPAVAFVVTGVLGTRKAFWWDEVSALVASGTRPDVARWRDPQQALSAMKAMSDDDRRRAIAELRGASRAPIVEDAQLESSDLRALASAGIEIGNHTNTHPVLTRCSHEVLRDEIKIAHDVIRVASGRGPRAFAYPGGTSDPRVAAYLAELGYDAAFTFDHRHAVVPAIDRFRISRLRIDSTTPPRRFETIVSGLHPALHHLRGRS